MSTLIEELTRLNTLSPDKQGFEIGKGPLVHTWMRRFYTRGSDFYYTSLNDEDETVVFIFPIDSLLYLVFLNNVNAKEQREEYVEWTARKSTDIESFNGFGPLEDRKFRKECIQLLFNWLIYLKKV